MCSTLNKETLLNKLLSRVTLSWRWTTNSFCSSTFSHWVLMSQKHWPAALLVNLVYSSAVEQTLQGTFCKMSIQSNPYYKNEPILPAHWEHRGNQEADLWRWSMKTTEAMLLACLEGAWACPCCSRSSACQNCASICSLSTVTAMACSGTHTVLLRFS